MFSSPRRAFGVLGCAAFLSVGSVAVMLAVLIRLSWPHVEPLGNPEFGINYSCNYAEYLLLEDPARGTAGYVPDDRPGRAEWCAATLGTLLRELRPQHLRLSVEWSQVEPEDGRFDFRLIDALLAEAEQHGTKVVLTVGLKAQRHPEFFVPDWVNAVSPFADGAVISESPRVREYGIRMVEQVVAHCASFPAIIGWGADNEPYIGSSRAVGWTISRRFVQEEVAAIRRNDPHARPVSINHGQHFVFDRRWRNALDDSDALAVSLYPFRNDHFFGRQVILPILEIGPLAPNYAHQARSANGAGKQFWITEMQAEPWAENDTRLHGPDNPLKNLDIGKFRRNIGYARRSGADRVYFWGAEWWLFQRERFGDPSWMETAAELFSTED
jgi:hypothetical protein